MPRRNRNARGRASPVSKRLRSKRTFGVRVSRKAAVDKEKRRSGVVYKSKLEVYMSAILRRYKRRFTYEPRKYEYIVPEHRRTYLPDWELDGGLLVETKGKFTSDDRKKMLLVLASHPDMKLLMVFPKPYNKINKASKTTYASWCDAHNIPWASLEEFEEHIARGNDADLLRQRKRGLVNA